MKKKRDCCICDCLIHPYHSDCGTCGCHLYPVSETFPADVPDDKDLNVEEKLKRTNDNG